jgi:hypothetical protein
MRAARINEDGPRLLVMAIQWKAAGACVVGEALELDLTSQRERAQQFRLLLRSE